MKAKICIVIYGSRQKCLGQRWLNGSFQSLYSRVMRYHNLLFRDLYSIKTKNLGRISSNRGNRVIVNISIHSNR